MKDLITLVSLTIGAIFLAVVIATPLVYLGCYTKTKGTGMDYRVDFLTCKINYKGKWVPIKNWRVND